MSARAIPISAEEAERLRAMRLGGLNAQEVADRTGHSRYIVETRAKLNKPKSAARNGRPVKENAPPPKKRKCLMCRDEFTSDWAGDRVCSSCKSSARWKDGI